MMNEKQAKKWEKQKKNLFLELAIGMVVIAPLFVLVNYLTHYLNTGLWFSQAELEAKFDGFISSVYGMTIGILMVSHIQEKRYQKYLANKKPSKKIGKE